MKGKGWVFPETPRAQLQAHQPLHSVLGLGLCRHSRLPPAPLKALTTGAPEGTSRLQREEACHLPVCFPWLSLSPATLLEHRVTSSVQCYQYMHTASTTALPTLSPSGPAALLQGPGPSTGPVDSKLPSFQNESLFPLPP